VLEELDVDEAGGALALARKRFNQLSGYDEQTQRRRLAAFLQRRGYDWPTVKGALDTLFAATGDGDDGEPLGDSDSYDYRG
jgi:regulatory protein